MGQVSDPTYIGGAPTGITTDNNGGFGVGPLAETYIFEVVPAAILTTALANGVTTAGAGNVVLTAGAGVTVNIVNGVSRYTFDTPRNVTFTAVGNISTTTFTVSGYDLYGAPMTETIVGPNATTVQGNKAFASIVTIAASAATTTFSIGRGDKLGLPFAMAQAGYIDHVSWSGALARDTGTFAAAVTTSPATSTTGDVRGTYIPSTATDGTKRLVMILAFPPTSLRPTTPLAAVLGVTQA